MLNSLLIKNYRLFKELQIDSLKRVNLIIGKNNVGKSALLEALSLYLNQETLIYQLFSNLNARGEWHINDMDPYSIRGHLDSLLTYRQSENGIIYLGTPETGINLNWFSEADGDRGAFLEIHDVRKQYPEQSVSLFHFHQIISSSSHDSLHRILYAGDSLLTLEQLSRIWSDIALTDREAHVIDALKIIDERVERLAFIDKPQGGKQVIVKYKGAPHPVSVNSMGDSISRILKVVLTLVKCENGTLLMDEFETGLHWSVQAELWKIIFHLSRLLNIQVFITTHSRDTLWALQQVAVAEELEKETRIIKLKALPQKQTVQPVELEVDQVKDLLEQGLEIR